MNLHLILTLLGIILLFLAAFGVNHPRVNLGWLGLAVLALTLVL
jgi:hypothetical protein